MAIDTLHEKIRKLKNPLIVDLSFAMEDVPESVLQENPDATAALEQYTALMLTALKGIVPGVRFSFSAAALLGGEGLAMLSRLMKLAGELGFYVLLDAPACNTPAAAQMAAQTIWQENSSYLCDGLVISAYIGSDAIKPFLPGCKDGNKDLFVVLRSPNKSASELQDLMTGGRLVHGATADLAARFGEPIFGKCGYSRVCGTVSAASPESIRSLRAKYKYMFFLVDGFDYPGANAKNCAFAFDRFGYGAAVCVGSAITGAWKTAENLSASEAAVAAAERIKGNLQRYFTIL